MDKTEPTSLDASPVDWSQWRWDIHATLMFVVRGDEVLLIRKKRGIGAGKVNGPGGKIDPGETPMECAVRETQEELHVTPLNPRKMGELRFAMSDMPDIYCHVYMADDIVGDPQETDEAIPMWTPVTQVPYQEMWADDVYWLPEILQGADFLVGNLPSRGETIIWSNMMLDVVDWE